MCWLSVVIPSRNEAAWIGRCLDGLERARVFAARTGALPGALEVIVSDGGSRDATAAIVRKYEGVRWIEGTPGRGRQLRRAACRARGQVLWFLHADSVVPPAALSVIATRIADRSVALGAFRFAIAAPGWPYRLIEWGVRWRSEWLQLPYGDQGLFCRRADYEAVGGIPPIDLMEDVELVRALRRRGRVTVSPVALETSARRWRRGGLLRTTVRNYALIAAWRLGAPTPALVRIARAFETRRR